MVAITPTIAITTISSIKVKPRSNFLRIKHLIVKTMILFLDRKNYKLNM